MALQRKLEKETIRTPALGRRYKCAPAGRMAQEANAWGNAQDMQTWAGCSGRQRASKCQGFRRTGSPVAKAMLHEEGICQVVAIGKVQSLWC